MARGVAKMRLRGCAFAVLAWALGLGCDVDRRDVLLATPGAFSATRSQRGGVAPVRTHGGCPRNGTGVKPLTPATSGNMNGACGASS
jgi:hypothetical protein